MGSDKSSSIPREYVLTPFDVFEEANNIRETRDDMSCPSYPRTVDMDVEKLGKKVARMLRKMDF